MVTADSTSRIPPEFGIWSSVQPSLNMTSDMTSDAINDTEHLMLLEDNDLSVPINGYVMPVVVIVTLATNCIVCAVLVRPHMRSPTNALLVAIATSDMLTGVWSVPGYAYFYTGGAYRDWVPYRWCFIYHVLAEYIPTMFHTASIWLTVALAVQRYIYVCHAMSARRLCTTPNFIRVIGGVFAAAFLSQTSRFFESTFTETEVASRILPNQTVKACLIQLTPFIENYSDVYFNIYFWFRVIFVHLVPCSALVVLTALLVDAMQRAQQRRQLLLKQNRRSESRRLAESNWTTLMLVAVVVVFLVVEIPLAILLILLIVKHTFDAEVVDGSANELATLFINMLIALSYPFNFVIYCGMSRQFRSTFRAMFCSTAVGRYCGLEPAMSATSGVGGCRTAGGADAENTNYVSMATVHTAQAPPRLPTVKAAVTADESEPDVDDAVTTL